jgi:hypothetical protein
MNKKYNVGDTAILTGVNMNGTKKVQVISVGRVNVYIEHHGWKMAFEIETGFEKGNYNHHTLYTLDEWAQKQLREKLTEKLDRFGVELRRATFPGGVKALSNEVLRKLLDVLESGSENG